MRFFRFAILLMVFNSLMGIAVIEVGTKRKPADAAWKIRETRILESATLPKIPLSVFGGNTLLKAPKTGFFHADKIEGKWYLVDPLGNAHISMGINSVRIGTGSTSTTAFNNYFADEKQWAGITTGLLKSLGFNTIGSWSDWQVLREASPRMPYTIMWNFMSSYGRETGGVHQQSGHMGYPNDCIFVFDKGFEAFCDKHAQQLAATKDDPYLIGHFSDNEMPLRLNMLDRYLELDPVNAGYQAATSWLAEKGVGADELNDAVREDFLEYVADRYFSIINRAIKRHDPNHLYLGCRFHGSALRMKPLFTAAGRHLDVISINWYGAWTPDRERMDAWARWADKPFIITEFYAKGMDSGLANNSGAGWTVRTQRERGYFYQNFTAALLEHPNCVGWHWHRYMDNELSSGEDPSNIDSNKGIISSDYRIYEQLVSEMKELNMQAYALRSH